MKILFTCTFWGCEDMPAEAFVDKVIHADYDGIEISLPPSGQFTGNFLKKLDKVREQRPDFVFIAQQLTSPENEKVDAYILKMERRLAELISYQPHFINSHTGKDYFSFDDNCRVIEAAMQMSIKSGMPIYHETHRGRFSFHASTLITYLQKFPELELVGDFSHFCVVSESMLQGQEDILQKIIPHVAHLHARIGSEQAPQVNDPAAPEWQHHLEIYVSWWRKILDIRKESGCDAFTITPEFGPYPYMPQAPFTQEALSNQWISNIFIANKLKQNFT